MDDNLGAIIERLKTRVLTDSDIQQIVDLLQRIVGQEVSQSGKFNLAVGQGQAIQVGDRYTGVTPEQIRLIVRELIQLNPHQSLPPDSSVDGVQDNESATTHLSFKKLVLDPATLEAMNARLDVIEEIYQAGYLSNSQQQGLRRLMEQLQDFSNLNQTLQRIAEEGDRLIQEAVAAMRLQLDALRLAGRELFENPQAPSLTMELNCQQAEAEIFQTFITCLDDSRAGAAWIEKNMELLINYASKQVLKQCPDLNPSEQAIDDFKFSLKQFLEQVNFSLYWGTYEILDSSDIPLVFNIDQYEIAFQSMKKLISKKELQTEMWQEIETCFDYLIRCLPFY